MPPLILPAEPDWYKDAVIYELHVRAFFDSANDGVGDFAGLTSKLDYLQDLGVTCLWLLPFYPSPLKDDGYDIANYEGIHPSYGTMRDFKTFLREAHHRDLRVVTELVINHTSDQHPWFQAARRAPAGSAKRDFYVWSDANRRYADARIIFTDTEHSNWQWDEEAKAYYWHRFFHHQPDLNFDNPHVRRAITKVLHYWLRMGVDGLRLDAIPYLIEREGTNCENLPETHALLKRIRAEVDARYTGRMLLAEANQWPADVIAYFGDGDECHMAFHFPLMPRIFMALRQEDRYPIVEILRQTPPIPEACQWAIFLRNHDELTLEMVTDEERDYMYQAYAADPQMRLNIGIRRRLAPLMENDRQRIELLYSLLFTLPGTPVIYYGDEIGMGDNVYLGDRNGVRTPMQWSSDRNAGFSRADFARLFAPPIMDPVYGYQAVNVEAQLRSPFSLLNWVRRMIAVRKQHRVFGRGSIEFLEPANRHVLAYVRRDAEEAILAVANLSRSVQPVALDVSHFAGLLPVELVSRTVFPRIGTAPYFLSLGPYAFYGFRLLAEAPATIAARTVPWPPAAPTAKSPLFVGEAWASLFDSGVRTLVERDYLRPFLEAQRWFGGKSRTLASATITDWGVLTPGPEPTFLLLVDVRYAEGDVERYAMPVALSAGDKAVDILRDHPQNVLAPVSGARKGVLHDAIDQAQATGLLLSIGSAGELRLHRGSLRAHTTRALAPLLGGQTLASLPARRLGADQSNTSFVYGDCLILKVFRRLEEGPNPEHELGLHLTERTAFQRSPRLAGALTYAERDGAPTVVAVLQELVAHQENGWDHAVEEVGRFFERALSQAQPAPAGAGGRASLRATAADEVPRIVRETVGASLDSASVLGRRTAELHLALATGGGDPSFAPQGLSPSSRIALGRTLRAHAGAALDALATMRAQVPPALVRQVDDLLGRRDPLLRQFDRLGDADIAVDLIRVHGDYHLGQVLVSKADYFIVDFEGEPLKSLDERRARQLALKDVAGMIRSFSYAAYAALFSRTDAHPGDFDKLDGWARLWQRWVSAAFLRTYRAHTTGASFVPADAASFDLLLNVMLLDKALYELQYELSHRPAWLRIPLLGIVDLLDEG